MRPETHSFSNPPSSPPLTAIKLAELAAQAGIPDGVFNVLPGYGEKAGRALGLHKDVDAVAFTGSTEVGKLFLQYSGQSNMKRIGLECGGKSPNIILADAPDLDAAATAAAWGIFYNQGEVCNAGSRLIVEQSVKDQVVEKVMEVGAAIKVGDPLDAATEMGAMVDAGQTERVMAYIEKGKAEGARLRLGGKRIAGQGCFIEATLFDDVTSGMTIAQEEIFGPVLATIAAKDIEEAVAIGNDTIYGLAAAVWTQRHQQGLQGVFGAAGRRCLGQLLRPWRHLVPLWWLQAVRFRPRQIPSRARKIHRAEGHLDPPGQLRTTAST